MTEERSSLDCTIMYLRKGIPLLLEDEVGSILVLLDRPEPEDAERGPLVLVDSLEPAVDDTRLELVGRARGDEELVCWRRDERRWRRRIVGDIPSATDRLGDMGDGWTGREGHGRFYIAEYGN
jgi:hypothetical protein